MDEEADFSTWDMTNVALIGSGPPSHMDEADAAFYASQTQAEKLPPLELIDPANWQDQQAPHRRWKVKDYVPDRQATLLTGAGSAGKSLVMQLMCTCLAAGLPFLGMEIERCVAIYITCEDDAEELHRRQEAICAGLGISMASLSGKLHLLSLQGEIGNELATFDREGRMHIAPRYTQIEEAAINVGAGFVTLDNSAHFFSGNENDRHQVGAFVGLCNRLAINIGGSTVIVGHPNKAGDSYSGSTAWENQVRSRLFMEIPSDDNGIPADPDMRVMRNEKSNYARKGSELQFMWFKGSFVLPDAIPEGSRDEMAQNAMAARENERFLACLDKLTEQQRNVSHSPNAMNYAPKAMAIMTEAEGLRKDQFERAIERLFSLGMIRTNAELWKGPDRKFVIGIARSEVREGAGRSKNNPINSMREGPAEGCGKVREGAEEMAENRAGECAGESVLYTTYMEGEDPLEGFPPHFFEQPDAENDGLTGNPILDGRRS